MAGNASQELGDFSSTLTDLMTSLAVIFILLLVVFLKQAHDHSKRAKSAVEEQLKAELAQKNLVIKSDPKDPLMLTVELREDQLHFPVGGASLNDKGGKFIDELFAAVATKVCARGISDQIDSIIIEGHTDTSGEKTAEGLKRNIALSQKRSFAVLERALTSVRGDAGTHECLLRMASASGRGSRSPIYLEGVYSPDLSRRVEIRFRVKSQEQVALIKASGVNVLPQVLPQAPVLSQ